MANNMARKAVVYYDGVYKGLLGLALGFVFCTLVYVAAMCMIQYDVLFKIAQAR